MIGDTITVTYDGVAKTLTKINQDNYSSEYLFRSATEELKLRIRHQNESVKVGQRIMERHQVELTRTEFDAVAGDRTAQAYMVVRLQKGTDPDKTEKLALSLCALNNATFVDKIANWES